jgi:hypothetical protein
VPVSESAYGAMARALVMLAERDEADGITSTSGI